MLYPALINVIENDIKPRMDDTFKADWTKDINEVIAMVPPSMEHRFIV